MRVRNLKPGVCKNPKCRKEFRRFSTLEKFCSLPCVEVVLPRLVRRGQLERKRKDRECRAERAATREKLKTIGKLLQEAQQQFNRWILQRDFAEGCISCDAPVNYAGQFTAGHYRTTAAAGHLRFNPDNVWKQCGQCNHHKSGNIVEYRIRLVRKIGAARVELLEDDNRTVKWDRAELVELRRKYVGLWKTLKAEREGRAS